MGWVDLCCLILGIDLWSWCVRFKPSCAKIFLKVIKLIKNIIYIYINIYFFSSQGVHLNPWITSAATPAKEPMNLCRSTRQPNHGLNMFIPDLVPCGLILQLIIATKLTLMELLLKMKIELGLGLSLEMTKIWWLLPCPRISLPHSIQELEALGASRILEFFLDIGIGLALEGDSELVINALKSHLPQ